MARLTRSFGDLRSPWLFPTYGMILHVLPSKNPAEHNRKESETQRVTREKKEQEEREKKIEKEYKVWYRLHHFSQVIGLQGYTIL